jgi:hypothetical protein
MTALTRLRRRACAAQFVLEAEARQYVVLLRTREREQKVQLLDEARNAKNGSLVHRWS